MKSFALFFLAVFTALVVLVGVVCAAVTYDEFTSSGTWTAPTGVYSVAVDIVGGGQGGSGGYGVYTSGSGSNASQGVGGQAGQTLHVDEVSVTPGNSYTITVGAVGGGEDGWSQVGGNPASIHNGTPGGATSAFGYTSYGGGTYGTVHNVSVAYFGVGETPVIARNGSVIGESTGIGEYYYSDDGTASSWGPGTDGGRGYGAGGGTGGKGCVAACGGSGYYGGDGGNGAPGYVRITYNTDDTDVYISGYVKNAENSTAINSATVYASQSGSSQTVYSNASGYYSFGTAFIYGVPITITTSKTGYNSSVVEPVPFIPARLTINQTLQVLNPSISNSTIGSVVRAPPYYIPIREASIHLQNTTTGELFNATTNLAGYAYVTNLTSHGLYYMWANYNGINSTVLTVYAPWR